MTMCNMKGVAHSDKLKASFCSSVQQSTIVLLLLMQTPSSTLKAERQYLNLIPHPHKRRQKEKHTAVQLQYFLTVL